MDCQWEPNKTYQSEGGKETFCNLTSSNTELICHIFRKVHALHCVLVVEHELEGNLKEISWWCVLQQDVGCSPCFLLLLQTPGGPHEEGKSLFYSSNVVFHTSLSELVLQLQWHTPLWICNLLQVTYYETNKDCCNIQMILRPQMCRWLLLPVSHLGKNNLVLVKEIMHWSCQIPVHWGHYYSVWTISCAT